MGWNLEANLKGPTNGMRYLGADNRYVDPSHGSFAPQTLTMYATYNYMKPAGATFAHIAHGAAGQTDVQWTFAHWTLLPQRGSNAAFVELDGHAIHTDGDTYQSLNTSLHGLLDVRNEPYFHLFVNVYTEGGWVVPQPVGIQVTWYGPTI